MNKHQYDDLVKNIDEMADSLMVLENEIDDLELKETLKKLIVNFFHIRQAFLISKKPS